ncbi:MAG TPA: hypothetical protein VHM90_17400, partial [Phycisphaerae bacterium]|nr:hypothetical protein [Phycisphaerae bacterium]
MAWLGGSLGIAGLGALLLGAVARYEFIDALLRIARLALIIPAFPALLLLTAASFLRRSQYPGPFRHPYGSA